MNYNQALEQLDNRDRVCLKRSKLQVWLERCDDDKIAVRLVDTDIVTFAPNGDVALNSGGWQTVTTKARINDHLPQGWHLWQEHSVWYLSHGWESGDVHVFEDGITIHDGGTVTGDGADPKEIEKLRKQAGRYADAFVTALFEGKVPAPSNGDCWFCLFREVGTGKTWGELGDNSHILGHFDEGYYVPSLLVRAVEVFPISPIAQDVLHKIWIGESAHDWSGGIARNQIRKSLYRYLKRQLGLAA
jgi:hypothetical protein